LKHQKFIDAGYTYLYAGIDKKVAYCLTFI